MKNTERLLGISQRFKEQRPPEVKDITDLCRRGGDPCAWVAGLQPEVIPHAR